MAIDVGEVVESEECPTPQFLVKCRLRKLVYLMSRFNDAQKEAVRSIGFGGLLDITFTQYPLDNVHLFIDAFNDRSHVFRASELKEFMVTKHDVHDCFLLPLGPNDLQILATGPGKDSMNDEIKEIKDRWREMYKVTKPGAPIPLGKITADIESDTDGGEKFRRLFVLFSMSYFLSPTSNNTVDMKLLSAVEDVNRISQLDWCTYVLDGMVEAAYQARKSPTCLLGCIPFLMITYFHRFDFRGQASPYDLPLVKHWDHKKMSDRLKGELVGGKLGRQMWSSVRYPRCLEPSYQPLNVVVQPALSTDNDKPEVHFHSNNHNTTVSKFIQIGLPPGVDDDEQLHSKAVNVAHELYQQMQRNVVAFHAWYADASSKIKNLTNPDNSQSAQAFFKVPALHRYLDEVVETSLQMKASAERASVFQEASSSQVRRVLDDLRTVDLGKESEDVPRNCPQTPELYLAAIDDVEKSIGVEQANSERDEVGSDFQFEDNISTFSTIANEVERVPRGDNEHDSFGGATSVGGTPLSTNMSTRRVQPSSFKRKSDEYISHEEDKRPRLRVRKNSLRK